MECGERAPRSAYGLLAVMALAPWLYGATPDWAVEWVVGALALVVLAWVLECAATRRMPRGLPVPAAAAVLFLLLLGTWMTFNYRGIFDPAFWTQIPRQGGFPGLPGAYDGLVARAQMERFMVLAGSLVLAADAARDPRWRRHALATLALTAVGLSILGFLQRGTGARDIYWGERKIGNFFFATWRYHANAGAFLNLAWPALAWLVWSGSSGRVRALWAAGGVVLTSALFLNGSRAASALAFAMGLAWVLWHRRSIGEAVHRASKASLAALALAVVLGAAFIALPSHAEATFQRWAMLPRQLDETVGTMERLPAWASAAAMLPEAGLFGLGPGSFAWRFRDYCADQPVLLRQFWRYAHQDYLHYTIDWGWLGAGAWALLLFGGLAAAFNAGRGGKSDRHLFRAVFLGLAVVALHAGVDFPLQILSIQIPVAVLLGMAWCRPPVPRFTG